jgi:hypothetical protein
MKVNGKEIPITSIAAITALGLAGFLGVAACSAAPATTSATDQPPPASSPASAPASSPSAAPASSPANAPASSPSAAPASSPSAAPAALTGTSPQQVAQWVANIAVGNGSLTALSWGDGQATYADCDPSTVSNPPGASTPASALCDIEYSDGSIWQQTVTITLDSQANPVSDSTNAGIELAQPANGGSGPQPGSPGYNPSLGNYLPAYDQAQNEQYAANEDQGPGITTNTDNDAGTGGDYDGSGD